MLAMKLSLALPKSIGLKDKYDVSSKIYILPESLRKTAPRILTPGPSKTASGNTRNIFHLPEYLNNDRKRRQNYTTWPSAVCFMTEVEERVHSGEKYAEFQSQRCP